MESESQISDFPEYRKTGVQARFGLVGAVVLEARDAVGGGGGEGSGWRTFRVTQEEAERRCRLP